jgi:hypothetical protein
MRILLVHRIRIPLSTVHSSTPPEVMVMALEQFVQAESTPVSRE